MYICQRSEEDEPYECDSSTQYFDEEHRWVPKYLKVKLRAYKTARTNERTGSQETARRVQQVELNEEY